MIPPGTRAVRLRFQTGDRDAFRELVAPNLDTVFTLCLRMTGNRAEADELAQDTLIRALEHHRAYDAARDFRPWLLTIAANLCRDRIRSGWWRNLARGFSLVSTVDHSPEDDLLESESEQVVRTALATLPTLYREALALFHLEGMNYAEMEIITGVSESALKQRVRRGLVMLEEAINRLYPDYAKIRTVRQEP